MSRDPSRELDDFRDAVYAKAERDAQERSGREHPAGNPGRPSDQERQVSTLPRLPTPHPRADDSRGVLCDRYRRYHLRASEIRTLADVGKFRALGAEDLATHAYSGNRDAIADDLRDLLRQGLIRRGTAQVPEGSPRELLTLTKAGYCLLHLNRIVRTDQAIYHGFVKPREANHDADLYTLYQKEAARIQAKGGRPLRVILEFELKRKINQDFAKFGTAAGKEIARRHGLRVVRGRIPLPDVRIEYERPDGEVERVDLELVTEHYRGQSVADKVLAGFFLYARRGEGDRLRRVLGQKELTAEVFSL